MTIPRGMTPDGAEAARDALGLLRAAARGDDESLAVCAAGLGNAPLTAAIMARWMIAGAADRDGPDVGGRLEEWAVETGLA